MADIDRLLHDIFGFPGFRGVQQSVVERVMAGTDTLAVMPTGAGKSLCYQLPAVARPGTGLVISPLIVLMEDQVRSATAMGIRAAALTSASEDRLGVISRFRDGQLDLLYVAPERASTDGFRRMIEDRPLALVAIDEAHCVSEWGHDFRPDYRLLRPLLDGLGRVPRLALTATADKVTRADILAQLGIGEDGLIVAGFDRPNIRYAISPRDGLPRQLGQLLAEQAGAGIIYAPTRDGTEKLAAALGGAGREVRAYHAGLDARVRAANHHDFVASEDMVMVATVAFGMGIDKPDVRFVAHAGVPKSIESYYQETGRAGRDGDPAVAHLFWGAEDFARARRRIETEVEDSRRAGERQRLNALGALVETGQCRRAILLRHFGETPAEACSNCDNCLNPPARVDASAAAQKLLSAAYRTGQRYGLGYLTDILAGKAGERALMLGHDQLSVFGIADAAELAQMKSITRALTARDALRADEHGGLALGPAARAILRGEETLTLAVPPPRPRKSGRARNGGGYPVADMAGDPLFEALRVLRRDIARERDVPPYVVFHDSTLRALATLKPASLAQMGEVPGIGRAKLDAYGERFLAAIAAAGQ